MIQEFINNLYKKYYPKYVVLCKIHRMYEANRELIKAEKLEKKENEEFIKWYSKHGKKYHDEMDKHMEEERRQRAEREASLIEILRERKERTEEERRLEIAEAMKALESKFKRKKLDCPRLLALKRKRKMLKEELYFELYAEAFDPNDTRGVSAFNWVLANAQ